MARAIELARGGEPSPNPHVGCVVADGGTIVGEGVPRARGARPRRGRRRCGPRARPRGARRSTSRSSRATTTAARRRASTRSSQAGIARVVIGCRDPNPHVEGGGVERLREAGVEVVTGVLRGEARALIRPWTKFITEGTSYLSLEARALARRPHRDAHRRVQVGHRARKRGRGCTRCAARTTP